MGLIFEISLDGAKTPELGRIAPILIPFSQDPLDNDKDFEDTISMTSDYNEKARNIDAMI